MQVFLACTYNAKIKSSSVGGQVVICSTEKWQAWPVHCDRQV